MQVKTLETGEVVARILDLKRQLQAVIVAHNYQRPEVQDLADFVGDSLELARQCAQTKAKVIVFCGVHFMAENAAILNPESTVLLAEASATCPMADMIDVSDLREWKARYPQAAVVCYVNSTAAVKAESDICCTSANAVKVVESLPQQEILFVPDQHLAHFVATKTKKRIIPYPGYCITHRRLSAEQVRQAKLLHPEAKVIVHPECTADVIALADAVLSTSQMVRYAKESEARVFLVGTEGGLLHRLKKENLGKEFYVLSPGLVCPNMKRTRLESILRTMEGMRNIISIPEGVRKGARQALERMLAVQ